MRMHFDQLQFLFMMASQTTATVQQGGDVPNLVKDQVYLLAILTFTLEYLPRYSGMAYIKILLQLTTALSFSTSAPPQ